MHGWHGGNTSKTGCFLSSRRQSIWQKQPVLVQWGPKAAHNVLLSSTMIYLHQNFHQGLLPPRPPSNPNGLPRNMNGPQGFISLIQLPARCGGTPFTGERGHVKKGMGVPCLLHQNTLSWHGPSCQQLPLGLSEHRRTEMRRNTPATKPTFPNNALLQFLCCPLLGILNSNVPEKQHLSIQHQGYP